MIFLRKTGIYNDSKRILSIFLCEQCGGFYLRDMGSGLVANTCRHCKYKNMSGNKCKRYKHGGKKNHPQLYKSWKHMRERCTNPNDKRYHRYGGRGISICEEWGDFAKFMDWSLAHGYKPGLTIDRIDIDRGYCPENCQWLTLVENSKKKCTTKISDEDAAKIRRMVKGGAERSSVAEMFGVTTYTIHDVVNFRTHKPLKKTAGK